MAGLTTHVLDIARGRPAAGVRIDLYAVGQEGAAETRHLLATATTNADGRLDAPLLGPDQLQRGVFELVFHVGTYFTARGAAAGDLPFLDIVPVRFRVDDSRQHYHVPLLVAPGGYSTYRGS